MFPICSNLELRTEKSASVENTADEVSRTGELHRVTNTVYQLPQRKVGIKCQDFLTAVEVHNSGVPVGSKEFALACEKLARICLVLQSYVISCSFDQRFENTVRAGLSHQAQR